MASPLSNLLRQALRRRRDEKPPVPTRAFDWESYRAHHRDLTHLSDEAAAWAHYADYGRNEGRLSTEAAVRERVAALEAADGPLPADFVWTDYIANNADLSHITASYDAVAHFLTVGRHDGRLYRRFDADLYQSLYLPGATLPPDALAAHFKEVGIPAGHVASLKELAAAEKIDGGRWLEALDVAEFELLNGNWAGPVANKRDALRAMIREGFERIAPLSFALDFDPAYYAEANPGLAALRPADRYRHWLFTGMASERPGHAIDHLGRHGLALSAFPEGFDWQRYRAMDGVHGDSCWALLDHVVANNAIPADRIPLRAEDAGAFLAALAGTLCQRIAKRGTDLFQEAARHGTLSPADHARWADGLARQALWAEALDHYDIAIADEQADIATILAGTRAALEGGWQPRAIAMLRATRSRVGGDVRWRALVRETIQRGFGAAWVEAEVLYAKERRAEADALLTATVAEIAAAWHDLDPLGVALPAETPPRIVMLANVDLRQCTHYRVEQKQEIFAAAGVRLDVYPQDEVDDFITALPGATAALFYRLPAMPMNVRAITVCRALGIPSYYDIDDLIFDAAHYPEPIATYGAGVSLRFYHSLELGVPLFRAAMALCDYGIASTSFIADHMNAVVRRGRSFVLPNGLDSRNRAFLDVTIPKVRRDSDIVLFYGSGTKAHNSDFLDLVGGALLAVMERHATVRLMIAGFLTLDQRFSPYLERIVQVGWTASVQDYWSLLAEADINLAVLVPGPTTDGKSEIKWLEAATLGVPSVVSATHRYLEALEDGVDALVAQTPADWQAALEHLVTSSARRAAIVGAARAKARAAYGLERNAERLHALLAPALASVPGRAVPVSPRKKTGAAGQHLLPAAEHRRLDARRPRQPRQFPRGRRRDGLRFRRGGDGQRQSRALPLAGRGLSRRACVPHEHADRAEHGMAAVRSGARNAVWADPDDLAA